MKTQHGNLDARFVYQGNLTGVTGVTPGEGSTPAQPLAEHGGMLKFVIDVNVPAIVAGTNVDWSITYPGQYTTPEANFDLMRYSDPIDTSKKLHARGNLWLKKAVVFQGSGYTGAAEPTQGGGTFTVAIRTAASLLNLWARVTTTMQTGQRIVTPTLETAEGVIIGTDAGEDKLRLTMAAVGTNIVAGRYRILLLGCEV